MRLVRKVTAITVSALSLLSALFVSAENISGDVSPETVAAEIPYSSFYAVNGAELTQDVFDGISAATYKNETGYIEAEFDIKAKGDYVVSVKYYPLEGKGRDIEFGLSIDGSPVGEESSNYSLPRTWKDDFAERKQDAQGNELRSSQSEVYKWKTVTLRSFEAISDLYSTVNLSEGRHTIRVEAFREPFAIAALPPPHDDIPTFIRQRPISVTTIPDTNGVMILRAYLSMLPTNTSTTDAAIHEPNTTASPPPIPAAIIGPMNE